MAIKEDYREKSTTIGHIQVKDAIHNHAIYECVAIQGELA